MIFYKIAFSCGTGLNDERNYAKLFFFFKQVETFFLIKKMVFTPRYWLLHSIPSFLLPFICDRSKSSRDAFSNFLLSLVALTAQYIYYIRTVSSWLLLCNGTLVSFLTGHGQISSVLCIWLCPKDPNLDLTGSAK